MGDVYTRDKIKVLSQVRSDRGLSPGARGQNREEARKAIARKVAADADVQQILTASSYSRPPCVASSDPQTKFGILTTGLRAMTGLHGSKAVRPTRLSSALLRSYRVREELLSFI